LIQARRTLAWISSRGVPDAHPDDDPAQCGEFLETLDVLGELAAVGAVVVTVVLDGDLEVLPAHIQEVGPAASPHPNLSLRLGKARLDDEQPQPGFLRGFRSGVIQAQHSRNLANPTNSAMAGSDVQHVGAVEGRRCTEGVQPRHGAPQQRAARQVEGGARQGRDRDAAQHDRLPRCKTERRGDDARRGPSVRPGQFDRLDVVNPFGSVQPCRGESCNNALPPGPQPRPLNAVAECRREVRRQIDARKERSIFRPKLVLAY
jgi:hypothetical protein